MQETLKNIRHQFFAFRNGIVADALRKQFDYRMIFGLQIPQIAEIARQYTPSSELAETLWAEKGNRESRLLATYLFRSLIHMSEPPRRRGVAYAVLAGEKN